MLGLFPVKVPTALRPTRRLMGHRLAAAEGQGRFSLVRAVHQVEIPIDCGYDGLGLVHSDLLQRATAGHQIRRTESAFSAAATVVYMNPGHHRSVCHLYDDWKASIIEGIDDRLVGGLVVLAAVANARSFGRAAERLGMTQSGVSKAIAKLESRLCVRLVHRTPP